MLQRVPQGHSGGSLSAKAHLQHGTSAGMQPWDDGASWAEGESAYAGPVRQSPSIITLRASLAGLLASGVAIATLTKIGEAAVMRLPAVHASTASRQVPCMPIAAMITCAFQLPVSSNQRHHCMHAHEFSNAMQLLEVQPLLEAASHAARGWSSQPADLIHACACMRGCCQLPLSASAAYQTESIGRDGAPHNFQKPWFLVMVMFLGERFCYHP